MKDRKKATLVLPLCSWHTPNTLASNVIDGKTNERTNERTSEWRQKQAAASISSLNGGVGGKYDKRLHWVNLHKAHIHIQQMSHKLKTNQRRKGTRWLTLGTSHSNASGQVLARDRNGRLALLRNDLFMIRWRLETNRKKERLEQWCSSEKKGRRIWNAHSHIHFHRDGWPPLRSGFFCLYFFLFFFSYSPSVSVSLSLSLYSSSSLSSSSCSRLSFPRLLWPEYSDWQKTHIHT